MNTRDRLAFAGDLSRRAAASPVRAYQAAFAWRPSPCRYYPTCSDYALEAISRHGAVKGWWLAVRRILRCHPWAPWGLDPVPEPHHRPRTNGGEAT